MKDPLELPLEPGTDKFHALAALVATTVKMTGDYADPADAEKRSVKVICRIIEEAKERNGGGNELTYDAYKELWELALDRCLEAMQVGGFMAYLGDEDGE